MGGGRCAACLPSTVGRPQPPAPQRLSAKLLKTTDDKDELTVRELALRILHGDL